MYTSLVYPSVFEVLPQDAKLIHITAIKSKEIIFFIVFSPNINLNSFYHNTKESATVFDKSLSVVIFFSFANYNAHEMLATLRYAMSVYYNNKKDWNRMMIRAMSQDFSWNSSAAEYEKLYQKLLED